MIPLIPALALAFVSFISSAFVLLYIIIPILPPHPLSRRVAPVRIMQLSFTLELTCQIFIGRIRTAQLSIPVACGQMSHLAGKP
jgi:hypothetical protein